MLVYPEKSLRYEPLSNVAVNMLVFKHPAQTHCHHIQTHSSIDIPDINLPQLLFRLESFAGFGNL